MAETEWTNKRPTADGDYFYRWEGQECMFAIAFGKVWGYLSGDEQHPPLEGAEWLGPFTAADFEQLVRLRRVAELTLKVLDDADYGLDVYSLAPNVKTAAKALREALGRGK